MSGSFSQQLEDLLNPQPKFADPEDDGDEETKARVIEKFNEDDDEEEEEGDGAGGVGLSALRKHTASLLSDTDRRYAGKAVSRKQLMRDMEGSEEEEEEDDDEEDGDEEEGDEEEAEDGDEDEEEDEDADDVTEEQDLDKDDEDNDINDDDNNLNDSEVTFPKEVDFHKLTEGMDDLGVSEEEEEEEEEEDSGEESEEDEEEESSEDDDMEQDDSTVRTFSQDKVEEEVEKGKAVKNQLALWDQLLEGRIKIQKALATANQLPQPPTFLQFKSYAEFTGALKNSHKALKALQRSLLELHDHLLVQNPDTKAISLGERDDEEIISDEDDGPDKRTPKRKLEMAEYPDFMAKRFAAFTPYQNATLQKWHDKTRLTMGKSSKSFGAFERNILTQIEQVLMDKDRLIRRTQTRRSEYKVMGKQENALTTESALVEGEEPEQQQLKSNSHLKDLDEDIFDDDDFYHQLLRELIERKTSAADPNDQVAMGKQWLAIQKLRSKIKKKVDTKASKGRKVRYHVHSKLVNFMAPIDHSSMGDEARSELYRGLFGQNSTVRE